MRVLRISAFARTLRRSAENRGQRGSRPIHATEASQQTMFSSFRAPKWSPRSLWGALGGLLMLLCDPPGRQLRPLGTLPGALWRLLGRSWPLFRQVSVFSLNLLMALFVCGCRPLNSALMPFPRCPGHACFALSKPLQSLVLFRTILVAWTVFGGAWTLLGQCLDSAWTSVWGSQTSAGLHENAVNVLGRSYFCHATCLQSSKTQRTAG